MPVERKLACSRAAVGAVFSLDHPPFKKPIVTVLIQNHLQKLVKNKVNYIK